MKTSPKNKLVLSLIIFLQLSLMMLSGCHNRSGEEKSLEGSAAEDGLIRLTQEQIAANDLVLGEPVMHKFSGLVEATGQLEALPRNRAIVSAINGGVIRELALLPGNQVGRGQTLFRIENQELLQLQEDYLTASASLAFLKDDYERQKLLTGENVAARKLFLKAESDYLSTQARFSALEARLTLLHIDKEALRQGHMVSSVPVISPISGFVASVTGSNGLYVTPETPVMEIVETSPLMVSLQLFEKDIPVVREGQIVRFRIPEVSPDTLDARVITTGKALSDLRTVMVYALFTPKLKGSYLPGMFVKAEIITESFTVMALPLSALISGDGGELVLVKSDPRDDLWLLSKVRVVTGMKQGDMVEIKAGGLAPGDRVVISGAFSVPL